MWGDDSKGEEMGDETMVLGDVINPAPVVVQSENKSALSGLAPYLFAGLLGVGGPLAVGAGALGMYLFDKATNQEQLPTTDETVRIKLGRIEDYPQFKTD